MNFKYLENFMANVTESLTRVRPLYFVRNLQFVLIFITLAWVTFILVKPYFGQPKVDTSPDGAYSVGKSAPETVVSSKEIYFDDEEKTQQARAKAEQSVPYHFDKDYSILTNVIDLHISEDVEALKEHAASSSSSNYNSLKAAIPRWRNRTNDELKVLLDYPRKDKLKQSIQQYSNIVFSVSCVLKESHPESQNLEKVGGKIHNEGKKESESFLSGENIFPRSELYRNTNIVNKLNSVASENIKGYSPEVLNVIVKIGLYYIFSYPACTYNSESTENARAKARKSVETVKSKISSNQILVRSGEIITPEIHNRIEITNRYASRANLSSIISTLLIQIIFVFIIASFLIKYNHKRLNDVSSNVVVFSMIWMICIFTFIVSQIYYNVDADFMTTYYFTLFIPLGMVCLLISFIYDEKMALAMGFYLSFFIFFASKTNSTSLLLAISTSVVGALYGVKIRKRIDFLKAALLLTIVQMAVSTSGYLFDSRDYWVSNPSGSFINDFFNSNIFRLYLLCIINGFLSAIAMQFLLPIYEYIFNIPTRFKLVELADTGHPLLQELLTKAPSTYTHTFLVAAMSERAARNLGLDWLLTRVGVYYHDIGKIPNAGFFIENQHLIPKLEHIDKNNPSIAAKVVIDHVLDGIEMAKKARLPREVINFIPEHHGTSTMAFFYHKALANLSIKQRRNISKSDFQYPGPIPQSKETAIVMIADSLEAASRSLDEVNPQALDDLIKKIINSKLAENQLDESGLTLGDLEVIKTSFKEVLLSSLHQRPKYPKPEDTKLLETQQKSKAKSKN
ncbi:HD family phosphohydrolase [Leptospira sp. GIMC2001]|uniref:HD family phosphohydrolase n=1 Tax=Leptospira sp. GIMC2001 TaxID=1513297 RepID=UPI00234906AE|nr:HDIG domain-containing metalloprotein [Leptospira sp. GIMC2001]WCL48308.1 HDIG domain-containing protein [Leptospira sp. GIMC2001]